MPAGIFEIEPAQGPVERDLQAAVGSGWNGSSSERQKVGSCVLPTGKERRVVHVLIAVLPNRDPGERHAVERVDGDRRVVEAARIRGDGRRRLRSGQLEDRAGNRRVVIVTYMAG